MLRATEGDEDPAEALGAEEEQRNGGAKEEGI